jgi:hypothetical protein
MADRTHTKGTKADVPPREECAKWIGAYMDLVLRLGERFLGTTMNGDPSSISCLLVEALSVGWSSGRRLRVSLSGNPAEEAKGPTHDHRGLALCIDQLRGVRNAYSHNEGFSTFRARELSIFCRVELCNLLQRLGCSEKILVPARIVCEYLPTDRDYEQLVERAARQRQHGGGNNLPPLAVSASAVVATPAGRPEQLQAQPQRHPVSRPPLPSSAPGHGSQVARRPAPAPPQKVEDKLVRAARQEALASQRSQDVRAAQLTYLGSFAPLHTRHPLPPRPSVDTDAFTLEAVLGGS